MKKGTPQCVAPMRPQKFVLCFLYIPLRKNDHWTEIRLLLININNFKQRVSVQWSFFLNEKQKRTGQKKGHASEKRNKKCKSRMLSADVGVPKWHWTMPCLKHTLVVQCFGLKLPKKA